MYYPLPGMVPYKLSKDTTPNEFTWQGDGSAVYVDLDEAILPASADFVVELTYNNPANDTYVSHFFSQRDGTVDGRMSFAFNSGGVGGAVSFFVHGTSGSVVIVPDNGVVGINRLRFERSGDDFIATLNGVSTTVTQSGITIYQSRNTHLLWQDSDSPRYAKGAVGPVTITTGGTTTVYSPIPGTRNVSKSVVGGSTTVVSDAVNGGTDSDLYTIREESGKRIPKYFQTSTRYWDLYWDGILGGDTLNNNRPYDTGIRTELSVPEFAGAYAGSWGGGVIGLDGKIYGMPDTGTGPLVVDTVAGTASIEDMGMTHTGSGRYRAGGVLGPDGIIYGVPYNSEFILKINTATGLAEEVDYGLDLSDSGKWQGAVLGPNGKIYGIPFGSNDILIIDTIAQTATRSNMGATITGTGKWSGGTLAKNGKIYACPAESTVCLIIDTVAGTATTTDFGITLTGSTKWYSNSLGVDGKIYGLPFSAADILIIDPSDDSASRSNMGATLTGSAKWLGSTTGADGRIYGIPFASTDILIIDVASGTASRSALTATLTGASKWFGGTLGTDGLVYGWPWSDNDFLKITGEVDNVPLLSTLTSPLFNNY